MGTASDENPFGISEDFLQSLVDGGLALLNKKECKLNGTTKGLPFYTPPVLSSRHRQCLPGKPTCGLREKCMYFNPVANSKTASARTIEALGGLQARSEETRNSLAYHGDGETMAGVHRLASRLRPGMLPKKSNAVCGAGTTNQTMARYLIWITFAFLWEARLKIYGDVFEAGVKCLATAEGPDGVDELLFKRTKWPRIIEGIILTYEAIKEPGRWVLGTQPTGPDQSLQSNKAASSSKKLKGIVQGDEGHSKGTRATIEEPVIGPQPLVSGVRNKPQPDKTNAMGKPSQALPAQSKSSGRKVLADARLNSASSSSSARPDGLRLQIGGDMKSTLGYPPASVPKDIAYGDGGTVTCAHEQRCKRRRLTRWGPPLPSSAEAAAVFVAPDPLALVDHAAPTFYTSSALLSAASAASHKCYRPLPAWSPVTFIPPPADPPVNPPAATAPPRPRLTLGPAGTLKSRSRATSQLPASDEVNEDDAWNNLGMPRQGALPSSSASKRRRASRDDRSTHESNAKDCSGGSGPLLVSAAPPQPPAAMRKSRAGVPSTHRRFYDSDEIV